MQEAGKGQGCARVTMSSTVSKRTWLERHLESGRGDIDPAQAAPLVWDLYHDGYSLSPDVLGRWACANPARADLLEMFLLLVTSPADATNIRRQAARCLRRARQREQSVLAHRFASGARDGARGATVPMLRRWDVVESDDEGAAAEDEVDLDVSRLGLA